MRIHLCVVGRLRRGPEADLIADYLDRFAKAGRGQGLGPVSVHEVEDKRGGGMRAEADLLTRALPKGATICALDERGVIETSPVFARRMAVWRDTGTSDLAYVIGGADGLDPALRARADHLVSLGKMVWPHMLARVMLSEQLYRAATILAGGPYHRV
ncbi:MAG: 23S rRNA (pseudouridine(1915)-N(3))-methyltransferase RlmH [Paracoccaceae bacterium]